MSSSVSLTAPTQFLDDGDIRYAYRRFGQGAPPPLLCLQHFTGTLDNWDPALTDLLAQDREVILFDNAGVGGSTGKVPDTVEGMTQHVVAFMDGMGLRTCDVLGFSLGGMVAQVLALSRPNAVRRLVLVGTAPRGGEDVMHFERPVLAQYFSDPNLKPPAILQKIFFTPTESGQAAGAAFLQRFLQRTDRDPLPGPEVGEAQMASFRDWEKVKGERFAELKEIPHPTLVMNGVHDEMIPVRNSYWLAENLPNAVLIVYPDAGHGSLFQWHTAFAGQVAAFLGSKETWAPY